MRLFAVSTAAACEVPSRHVSEREKKIYSPQANNRGDNQNKLMWQTAREEIPI